MSVETIETSMSSEENIKTEELNTWYDDDTLKQDATENVIKTETEIDPPEEKVEVEDEEKTSDEYHYLNKGEFSSENFKVLVKNIPKRVTYGVS